LELFHKYLLGQLTHHGITPFNLVPIFKTIRIPDEFSRSYFGMGNGISTIFVKPLSKALDSKHCNFAIPYRHSQVAMKTIDGFINPNALCITIPERDLENLSVTHKLIERATARQRLPKETQRQVLLNGGYLLTEPFQLYQVAIITRPEI
jgi:hypothetical protein